MTGATMLRASAPDRTAGLAKSLRAVALQLQSFADLLAEPSEPAAGQSLGSDDELTPDESVRVDAAVARFRERSKQAKRQGRSPGPAREAQRSQGTARCKRKGVNDGPQK